MLIVSVEESQAAHVYVKTDGGFTVKVSDVEMSNTVG